MIRSGFGSSRSCRSGVHPSPPFGKMREAGGVMLSFNPFEKNMRVCEIGSFPQGSGCFHHQGMVIFGFRLFSFGGSRHELVGFLGVINCWTQNPGPH